MDPQKLSPPQQELASLVFVVATLGKAVAIMSRQHWGAYPRSLHAALRSFTWLLSDTLGHRGVPSLGRALAACKAGPEPTWADVRAAAGAWRESVAALIRRWSRLVQEASELHNTCREAAAAATDAADAAAAQAGGLRDKLMRCLDSGDKLAAAARRLPLTPSGEEGALVRDLHRAAGEVTAAHEAARDALTARSRARAAAGRAQRAEVALELMKYLVTACNKATVFPEGLHRRLRVVEAALEGTEEEEASPDVPRDLVATVAEAKRVWDASERLFRCHLLGALGDIRERLSCPCGGHGGSGVAQWCRKTIEDIPRLLQDGDVTAMTSAGQ